MDQAAYDQLTPTERECLRHAGAGLERKQIAARLGISDNTVKAHVDRARAKLGASRTNALGRALVAFESGHPNGANPAGVMPSAFDYSQVSATNNAAVAAATVVREPTAMVGWQTPTEAEPIALSRGRTSDLGTLQRLGWIVLIALGLAILGIAAYPLAESAHLSARSAYPAPSR